ncbi:hypothetical protein M1116_03715 [Patescibacteria group bacterium]|nr:hypothetical protein [Patescibacteria group bacterium]
MKNNKRLLVVIAILLVAGSVGLGWWLTNQQRSGKIAEQERVITGTPERPTPAEIPITKAPLLQSPQKITWQIGVPDLPTNLPIYQGKKQAVTTGWVEKISSVLNISGNVNSDPTGNIYYANDTEKQTSLLVYQNEQLLNYSRNLMAAAPTPSSSKLDSQIIEAQLSTLLGTILPLPKGMNYQKGQMAYLTINESQFDNTNEAEADYVSFNYDWSFNGSVLKTDKGPAVAAVYQRNGILIKIMATIPPVEITKTTEKQTIDKGQVQGEKATVLDVNGVNFVGDFESSLTQASITMATLGNVYSAKEGTIVPAVIAAGNGVLSGGPITLTLAFGVTR